jgi:hypothetical protein
MDRTLDPRISGGGSFSLARKQSSTSKTREETGTTQQAPTDGVRIVPGWNHNPSVPYRGFLPHGKLHSDAQSRRSRRSILRRDDQSTFTRVHWDCPQSVSTRRRAGAGEHRSPCCELGPPFPSHRPSYPRSRWTIERSRQHRRTERVLGPGRDPDADRRSRSVVLLTQRE